MSKLVKINDIFGVRSMYHPNQIVAKSRLPRGGLCQKETMYRFACKISDLRHLYWTGQLAMDPFDFIRWRIILKAASSPGRMGPNPRLFIRRLIKRLCDGPGGGNRRNPYHDPVMREAVLLSAEQRNHILSYGPKRRSDAHGVARPAASSDGVERESGGSFRPSSAGETRCSPCCCDG
ncbi:hypothetical protein Trco_008437 [Trichoderma cornu-damae]|uniref:Uncharacterized protein n=1 Tax=Trichoderma cornu-damae TaxID=654480 RepID=A0A9P8QJE0_9HYPO|nr:hypothetical protein Trco_008437 [Trichoderma cornu-damae]